MLAKRLVTSWLLVAASALLVACGGSSEQTNGDNASLDQVVRTTIYPVTYFAERISGGLVPVESLIPEDADPMFWRPSREEISRYQKARLVIINGADYEKWIPAIALEPSRVVDSAVIFRREFLEFEKGFTHSHGPTGEHEHKGIDGHTWLSPLNAMKQASAIFDGMKLAFPKHAEAFENNFEALIADLDALDKQLMNLRSRLEGVTLMASHPAYNYLMTRMDYPIYNLDIDPDDPLTEENLSEIRENIPQQGRVIMLWEGEPLEANVRELTSMGVVCVVFSPTELLGEEEAEVGEDYLSLMRANIERFEVALGG